MEVKKAQLLAALTRNMAKPKGQQQDHEAIAEHLGLSEDEMDRALTELVNEGKLEFQTFGICNYVPTGN
jgi:predicted ArsR family transcriptional regulator